MTGLLRAFDVDEILITEEEHLQSINGVMTCLEDEGLTLKKEKCHFMLEKSTLSTQSLLMVFNCLKAKQKQLLMLLNLKMCPNYGLSWE